ncbi:eCIS core domain-containing protein [Pseudomonas sp. GM48]|uniref:eCIS core domain-containing protein n=1 Tax=Pseudomonas sp. GM48 TaxID=1144330 RepID=UPI00026FFFC0|nr:DUF4157 domain-containing protein [Pseudomonas sp. GM48]EJM52729.1 hypothetical protein PMI28_04475 [Pseudomonas sp. GM48]
MAVAAVQHVPDNGREMPKVSPADRHCLWENQLLAVFLRQTFRLAILLFSAGTSSFVLACPGGQYQVCMVACFCAPGSKEEIGTIFKNMNQMAASGLQSWIEQSRNTAATGDIRTIPLNIRAQLEPFYDIQVLDSARYKVGDDVELNAAHTMMQNPDVSAVTLIDIIVFRSPDDALNNVALWAHELKHVQQYLQWGVHEFATRYTRDYTAVETPAYAIQTQVSRALRAGAAQPEPPRNP